MAILLLLRYIPGTLNGRHCLACRPQTGAFAYLAAMFQQQHLKTAVTICDGYDGAIPLAAYLKHFFAQHKKYGSRDRKQISHLCYCGYRTGKALQHLPTAERIIAGLWLCSMTPNDLLQGLQPEWNEKTSLSPEQKLAILNAQQTSVFPWPKDVSEGLDMPAFTESFFSQPQLFIRLRPGHEKQVVQKLTRASISYNIVSENCLALANNTKLDSILDIDREAVIQDMSSQAIGLFMQEAGNVINQKDATVWDCCAASGGKSILWHDFFPHHRLWVSDIRESMLQNLKKRFARARIHDYAAFVHDAAAGSAANQYDCVLADVPCTGSGTWARTPEQLFFFGSENIDRYAATQARILHNIAANVKPGGFLLYSTCSVFKKENEKQVADFLQSHQDYTLTLKRLITGYSMQADTLFAALLHRKSNT
jgi:16S rRNA (cytosine967-C5)-methyltransferase